MLLTFSYYSKASEEWITSVINWACANWYMFFYSTFCQLTARLRAGVDTFEPRAG